MINEYNGIVLSETYTAGRMVFIIFSHGAHVHASWNRTFIVKSSISFMFYLNIVKFYELDFKLYLFVLR